MLKNNAREIGPIRPKYIVTTIISLAGSVSEEVKLRESPTVPIAETTSYKQSSNAPGCTAQNAMSEITITKKLSEKIDVAFLTVSALILRLKTSVFVLSERLDRREATRIINVVVLIPPAVPEGEPPINIKIEQMIIVHLRSPSCGIVQKPAVLVVTDWKREANILSPRGKLPIVLSFVYSRMKIVIAPPKISAAVTEKTAFA